MKISYQFLKTCYPHDLTPEELSERLTQQGLEVEYISKSMRDFELAVAHCDSSGSWILEGRNIAVPFLNQESYANDRRYVCYFNTQSQSWEICTPIVLGWSNLTNPLSMPEGIELSHAWDLDDRIIELSVTPNRGDCLNYVGLCREIALSLRQSFDLNALLAQFKSRYPVIWDRDTQCHLHVDSKLAPLYTLARVYVPSRLHTPFWLEQFLLKHGIGSYLPPVDFGHYLMLVFGIPTHTFDAGAISDTLHVSWHNYSNHPVECTLLDRRVITLKDECPVIMNAAHKVVALPGVIGTLESGARSDSHEWLIESALFNPSAIRSLRKFGIVTNASLRFERGVDRGLQYDMLELLCGFLQSLHNQVTCFKPKVLNNQDQITHQDLLTTTYAQIEKIAGMPLDRNEVENIVHLCYGQTDLTTDEYQLVKPSWRWDLDSNRSWVSEILRIYGMNRLELKRNLNQGAARRISFADPIIDRFVHKGFSEVVTYSFVHENFAKLFQPNPQDWIDLVNPVSADLHIMRPSMWPSLLQVLQGHQRFGLELRPIVESASVFAKHYPLRQKSVVSGAIPCTLSLHEWRQEKLRQLDFGYYEMKGLIDAIGLPNGLALEHAPNANSFLHPQFQMVLKKDGLIVGQMGRVHPQILNQFDWPDAWVFEIDQSLWSAAVQARPQYKAFSRYPIIRRDFALVCPKTVTAESITQVFQTYCQDIRQIEVFDYYVDPQKENPPSVGVAVFLQSSERTLQDDEIQVMISNSLKELELKHGVYLKGTK